MKVLDYSHRVDALRVINQDFIYRCYCKCYSVRQIDQSRSIITFFLQLQQQRTEPNTVCMRSNSWQHESRTVHWVLEEAIHCVLELLVCLNFLAEVLIPRPGGEHESTVRTPGQSPDKAGVLCVIQEQSVRFSFWIRRGSLFVYLAFWLVVVFLSFSIFNFFTLLYSKFMEKLNLILEFPVFVNSDCCIRWSSRYYFKVGMHGNTLYKFLVTFKSLNFAKLVVLNLP